MQQEKRMNYSSVQIILIFTYLIENTKFWIEWQQQFQKFNKVC